MTNFRRKPSTRFHAFIVEPTACFKPTNWRQTPTLYRIVRYLGPKKFRGSADAWKFLHNHEAMEEGQLNEWAIYLDFESAVFADADPSESKMAVQSANRFVLGQEKSGRLNPTNYLHQISENHRSNAT